MERYEVEKVNITKQLISMALYLGAIIVIIYCILTFGGQRTEVIGDSMNPTLSDGDNMWIDKLTYRIKDPKRYDIIVFPSEEDTYLVKRIIGLPGETVSIDIDGNIYINEEKLDENYGLEEITFDNIGRCDVGVTLSDDEYFVMGDNRNHSLDSRFEQIGNIKKEQIVGKINLRVKPLDSFGWVK